MGWEATSRHKTESYFWNFYSSNPEMTTHCRHSHTRARSRRSSPPKYETYLSETNSCLHLTHNVKEPKSFTISWRFHMFMTNLTAAALQLTRYNVKQVRVEHANIGIELALNCPKRPRCFRRWYLRTKASVGRVYICPDALELRSDVRLKFTRQQLRHAPRFDKRWCPGVLFATWKTYLYARCGIF